MRIELEVEGRLSLDVYDRNPARFKRRGRRVLDWRGARLVESLDFGCNIVTNNGLANIAHVVGNDASSYDFAKIAVGTGATAETAADTALVAQVIAKTFDTTLYPSSGKVRFDMVLETSEANGNTLQEAGLLSAAGSPVLIARKTFGAITKTSSFAFNFKWTLSFARA